MLANNICVLEKDIAVKRYTLPYFLGRRALYLFAAIYYLAYISIIAMVVLNILPPICLVSLLTIIIVQRNIGKFLKRQDKAVTFITAIKNYIAVMGSLTITLFLSAIF
jgi:1,4-dihydroxy-2-naphthoate octaprenyltransferase